MAGHADLAAAPAADSFVSPDPHRTAGHCLIEGIDSVLPLLRSTTGPAATAGLAADLRAALARTAARGDTCRVRAAADDVRRAAELLLVGSSGEAEQALRHARTVLADAFRDPGGHATPAQVGQLGRSEPAGVASAGSREPRWEAR